MLMSNVNEKMSVDLLAIHLICNNIFYFYICIEQTSVFQSDNLWYLIIYDTNIPFPFPSYLHSNCIIYYNKLTWTVLCFNSVSICILYMYFVFELECEWKYDGSLFSLASSSCPTSHLFSFKGSTTKYKYKYIVLSGLPLHILCHSHHTLWSIICFFVLQTRTSPVCLRMCVRVRCACIDVVVFVSCCWMARRGNWLRTRIVQRTTTIDGMEMWGCGVEMAQI